MTKSEKYYLKIGSKIKGERRCLFCGKIMKLFIKRDFERKKFCSRTCLSRYIIKRGNGLAKIWAQPFSITHRKRISESRKGKIPTRNGKPMVGENHPMREKRKPWRWYKENGSTIKFHQSQDWRDKVMEIFRRDNFICQECGRTANELKRVGLKLNCHHIMPIYKGGELFENNNLITLCEECHIRKHPELHINIGSKIFREYLIRA